MVNKFSSGTCIKQEALEAYTGLQSTGLQDLEFFFKIEKYFF